MYYATCNTCEEESSFRIVRDRDDNQSWLEPEFEKENCDHIAAQLDEEDMNDYRDDYEPFW